LREHRAKQKDVIRKINSSFSSKPKKKRTRKKTADSFRTGEEHLSVEPKKVFNRAILVRKKKQVAMKTESKINEIKEENMQETDKILEEIKKRIENVEKIGQGLEGLKSPLEETKKATTAMSFSF